jgi:hypothetical protein
VVEATGDALSTKLCAGSIPLELLSGLQEPCLWSLISDGGWPLSLGGSKAPAGVQGCKPLLAVGDAAAPAKSTALLELEARDATTTVYTVFRVTFEAKKVATCSAAPIKCIVP